MHPFFTSKHFLVGGLVALLLVAGGVWAVESQDPFRMHLRYSGSTCDLAAPAGEPLAAAPVEGGTPERRTVDYAVDPAGLAAGSVLLCTGVGELEVRPSEDGQARLQVVVEAHGRDAAEDVRAVELDVAFVRAGDALHVLAQPAYPKNDATGAGVSFVLLVPDLGPWDVRAHADVGGVTLDGLLARDVRAEADVGDVVLRGVHAAGNVTAAADVGEVVVDLASVQTGTVSARADVGDVHVRVPTRADVGYHAIAESDVAEVVVRLGEAELETREESGPGERVEVRTKGFADKPTRVDVRVTTDVGDILIEAVGDA